MSQLLNRKYRNKCTLHIADHLRGEAVHGDAPRRLAEAEGPVRFSQAEGPSRFSKESKERYVCLGFLFTRGVHVDPQDVADFKHMQWYRIELDSDLKMGALPSGLLLRSPRGEIVVVRNSELVPLDGQLETFNHL